MDDESVGLVHAQRPGRVVGVDTEDGTPPSVRQLLQAAPRIEGDGPPYWSRWSRDYDYLYVLFTEPDYANPDPLRLEPLYVGDRFVLYRINAPQMAQAAESPAEELLQPATAEPEAVARPGPAIGSSKARPAPTARLLRTAAHGPAPAKPAHVRPVRLERVSVSPHASKAVRDATRPRTPRRHGARPVTDRGTRKES